MPLSEKEKKELEILDNPDVEFLSPSIGVIPYQLFGGGLEKRRERVVELRTKLRMEELGLDADKDWQKYYEVKEEEEKCFNERFKEKK